MRTVHYRRWAPAKSAVKIEFPPDIIHDIRAQSLGEHDRGYLFGHRDGAEVRISTAIRTPQAGDPRTAGTEPVGVYFVRARGEVFLTDADLEQVERVPGGIAFVIAGGRAGFFARETDGSMQAVRSHEEFLVAAAAAQGEPLARPGVIPRTAGPPPSLWKWAVGLTALLGGPVAAFALLGPMMPLPPLALGLRETEGQLVIRWEPLAADATGCYLEITDAGGRTVLPVAAGSSSATYMARSGDVETRLSTGKRSGRVHWTSARFALPEEPAETPEEFHTQEQIREEMEQLQSQADYLRQAIVRRQYKVQQLTAAADKLLGPLQ